MITEWLYECTLCDSSSFWALSSSLRRQSAVISESCRLVAELLKSIHFALNGGNFALYPKLLQFPDTAERWAGRPPF